MITRLNTEAPITHNRIYSIDIEDYSEELKNGGISHIEHLINQIDLLCEDEWKKGYTLKTMSHYDNNYILVFQPKN